MYVINPKQNELDEWFCCGKRIGEYLVNKCKLPLIHKNGTKYYFAITKKLNEALDTVPTWMKLFELF